MTPYPHVATDTDFGSIRPADFAAPPLDLDEREPTTPYYRKVRAALLFASAVVSTSIAAAIGYYGRDVWQWVEFMLTTVAP